MAKTRPSTFRNMLAVLLIISGISGLSLGYVYSITKTPIARAKLNKKIRALQEVLPDFDNNPVNNRLTVLQKNSKDSSEVFPAFSKNKLTGIAITGSSDKGFNGLIKLIVGFNLDGSIKNIVVLEEKETPGLGNKMKSPAFIEQFIGKNPQKNNLHVKKDQGEIDALTGATISSRAFINSVQSAYEVFIRKKDSLRNF